MIVRGTIDGGAGAGAGAVVVAWAVVRTGSHSSSSESSAAGAGAGGAEGNEGETSEEPGKARDDGLLLGGLLGGLLGSLLGSVEDDEGKATPELPGKASSTSFFFDAGGCGRVSGGGDGRVRLGGEGRAADSSSRSRFFVGTGLIAF